MRRLARAYGQVVVVMVLAMVALALAAPSTGLVLVAMTVLALAETGLSVLWIRVELALIHDIRQHKELQ